nr:hypothetical protein BaRGS_034560 [Batillaria attramentaria]
MYADTSAGCFTIVPMIFVGYWNFAIFRYWRQNKLDADRRYPAMKEQQQQSSSSSQDKKVLCQEDRQNQKADDAAQPDQTGSLESLETQAKPSLVREQQQQQPSDQYNATMQQFHIRMKKERAKEQAFCQIPARGLPAHGQKPSW